MNLTDVYLTQDMLIFLKILSQFNENILVKRLEDTFERETRYKDLQDIKH